MSSIENCQFWSDFKMSRVHLRHLVTSSVPISASIFKKKTKKTFSSLNIRCNNYRLYKLEHGWTRRHIEQRTSTVVYSAIHSHDKQLTWRYHSQRHFNVITLALLQEYGFQTLWSVRLKTAYYYVTIKIITTVVLLIAVWTTYLCESNHTGTHLLG